MIREVFEETGLRVIASEIATIDSIIIHKEQEDLQAIRLIYSATTETNKVRSETVGTTDLSQWHPIDECDTLSLVDLARTAISSLKKKESSDLYERS